MDSTFFLIKPDGTRRKLIGKILCLLEEAKLKIAEMTMFVPTREQAQEHYESLRDKPFFDSVCNYICSGPVVAMILEGPSDVVELVRTMVGVTNPADASDGTIRKRWGSNKMENVVHCSDSIESANRERRLWFPHLFEA